MVLHHVDHNESSHPATISVYFYFNDTATTEIYTLSLHDALPIWRTRGVRRSGPRSRPRPGRRPCRSRCSTRHPSPTSWRSEEHTSELQSHSDLVCRLLLEKKKKHIRQYENRHHDARKERKRRPLE